MSTSLRGGLLRVLLLAMVSATACGPNPNAPSSMTGTWVGTGTSSVLGDHSIQLTLTQSGSSISGFYTATFPGQTTSGVGTVTGTVQGSSVTLALPTGTCTRTWTATWSGTSLTGTFVATGSCGNPDQGTFSLTLE